MTSKGEKGGFHHPLCSGSISAKSSFSNSRRLGDLAGTDTARADLDVLRSAVHHRTNPLKIREPAPFCQIMSVGNIISRHRTFSTDIASLRHVLILLKHQHPATGQAGIPQTPFQHKSRQPAGESTTHGFPRCGRIDISPSALQGLPPAHETPVGHRE